MPIRIQLSRAKGWRMPADTVKVDRSTVYGNPFPLELALQRHPEAGRRKISPDEARAFVWGLHRRWMAGELEPGWTEQRPPDLTPLRGKNLACWCRLDQKCHADTLLELANREGT